MSSAKPGDRVGAILSADKTGVVQFLGYGTYLGDRPCPVGPFGMSIDEMKAAAREHGVEYRPFTNPCIKLDNGRHVWGMQCWWGPESKVKEILAKYASVVDAELPNLPPLENA